MWRPSLPQLISLLYRFRHHVTRASHNVADLLSRLFSSYLPRRETVWNYALLWWRRFAGFSAAFLLAITPALTFLLLQELSIIPLSSVDQSAWAKTYIEFATFMTRISLVALFAVYFLRILYWFQQTLPRFWNRVTPPHVREGGVSKAEDVGRSVPDIFADAERNARKWFVRGCLFFFGVLSLLLLLAFVLEKMGLQPELEQHMEEMAGGGLIQPLTRVIEMLPLVGDLYTFAGELPGHGTLGKLLLNGTAVFFAIALRNWAYMFEQIDYVYAEFTWGRPFRYLVYILFYLLATLLTSLFVLLLATAELVFV